MAAPPACDDGHAQPRTERREEKTATFGDYSPTQAASAATGWLTGTGPPTKGVVDLGVKLPHDLHLWSDVVNRPYHNVPRRVLLRPSRHVEGADIW
jgi:hypothetical protein